MVTNPIKLLVYSPAGHGKTTLLGTCADDPRLWPAAMLEFEAGTRAIASKVRKISLDDFGQVKPQKGKIDVVTIQAWEDFSEAYDRLGQGDTPYRSICLDSLSEMNYLNLMEALQYGIKLDRTHDPDIAEQRDYLRSSNQMRKLIRYFRDLPLHVFFSAGAQTLEDPRTRRMQMWPQMVGKLAYELPYLVEIVGYLAVVEEAVKGGDVEYRALLTAPSDGFHAKDRTEGGVLGGMVREPTLPKILDLIEGRDAGGA